MGKHELEKDQEKAISYSLPLIVLRNDGLNDGAKGLFAVMVSEAGEDGFCRSEVRTLASKLGASVGATYRWRIQLKNRGLIRIKRERKFCSYYLFREYREGESIPLPAELMERRGVSQMYKLVLSWLLYKQDADGCVRAMRKDIAQELGGSVLNIQDILQDMKKRGEVEIRLRGRNRNKGNEYIMTQGAVNAI